MTSPDQAPATPERQQAADVRARYSAAVERARADRDLSDEGRARRIAELHANARDQLARLRSAEADRLNREYEHGRRELFDALRLHQRDDPARTVSVRDALDRASAARNPGELAELLHRAESVHDEALAAAAAREADQRSGVPGAVPGQAEAYSGVLADWLHARPELADEVADLARIENLLADHKALFNPFAVQRPREARGVSLHAERSAPGGPSARPDWLT